MIYLWIYLAGFVVGLASFSCLAIVKEIHDEDLGHTVFACSLFWPLFIPIAIGFLIGERIKRANVE